LYVPPVRPRKGTGNVYRIVFDQGAVMVLPAGVTHATGLAAALEQLALPRPDAARYTAPARSRDA
jgi:hypothetical protein